MCADEWDTEEEVVGECPECGAPVNEDGESIYGCNYAQYYCPVCGHGYCDGSC